MDGPTSFNATNLPAGLTVNTTTGLISGKPTTAGTKSALISAKNVAGAGAEYVAITIAAQTAPVITSAKTATGEAGTVFKYQITATETPTGYTATGLPAGLTVSATTGLISGTPKAAGTSTVTITASNAVGKGTETLTVTIAAE